MSQRKVSRVALKRPRPESDCHEAEASEDSGDPNSTSQGVDINLMPRYDPPPPPSPLPPARSDPPDYFPFRARTDFDGAFSTALMKVKHASGHSK